MWADSTEAYIISDHSSAYPFQGIYHEKGGLHKLFFYLTAFNWKAALLTALTKKQHFSHTFLCISVLTTYSKRLKSSYSFGS